MKYYSYVIPRDFGFAPNPYFNYCTLATCKPRIRKNAQIGDWIAAYGAASTDEIRRKLVMLMKVEETLSFDQYWNDDRFHDKKPNFNRAEFCMYGDNIYHNMDGEWRQESSHHSLLDGSINYDNLKTDTRTDRVLISQEFYYFGKNAINLPVKFDKFIGHGRPDRVIIAEEEIREFITFIRENYSVGIHGTPYSRENGKFAHFRGGK